MDRLKLARELNQCGFYEQACVVYEAYIKYGNQPLPEKKKKPVLSNAEKKELLSRAEVATTPAPVKKTEKATEKSLKASQKPQKAEKQPAQKVKKVEKAAEKPQKPAPKIEKAQKTEKPAPKVEKPAAKPKKAVKEPVQVGMDLIKTVSGAETSVIKQESEKKPAPRAKTLPKVTNEKPAEQITIAEPPKEAEQETDIYSDVVAFAVQNGEISSSLLQKKFRIGYAKAVAFLDRLAEDGYIRKGAGTKSVYPVIKK